jgi:hypothetical protein
VGGLMSDDQAHLDELEGAPLDEQDVRALATLRRIYELGDPVPPSLLDRVKFAITLDNLEAEVAQLQRDSVPELAGARSEDLLRARTITFTSDTITTMVTITPLETGAVRLDGWAAPGAFLEVEMRAGDSIRRTTADQDGRFVLDEVPRGLAQFVLREQGSETQVPVITPAVEL